MSGGATPGEPGTAAVDPGAQLTGLLEGFEAWLRNQPPLPAGGPTPGDGPDLATLLREFIALRQEVNLLTKATRAQLEQNAEVLASRGRQPPEVGSPDLKPLMDLRDALGRADREMRKARATLEQTLAEAQPTGPEPTAPPLPAVPTWLRWLGVRGPDLAAWRAYAQAVEQRQARPDALARVRQIVASLLDGYAMSVQRVDRLLQANGLEPIATEGERFDPEKMEALEPVYGSGRPAGEVVEELRRGYRHGERIVRFALVRVARDA